MSSSAEVYPKRLKLGKQRAVGIENELFMRGGRNQHITQRQKQSINKKILSHTKTDCGAIEFVTKPILLSSLKWGNGKNQLGNYYKTIQKIAKVSRLNGSHIHISLLDTDRKDIVARVLFLQSIFYKQLQKVAGRKTTWARSPGVMNMEIARKREEIMCLSAMPVYDKKGVTRGGRRPNYMRSYYMITPTNKNTLEFRGPKGTVKTEEMLAWIELLHNIVKEANRPELFSLSFKDLLKGKNISQYVASLPKYRQLTEEQLNQKLTEGAIACA